MEKHKLPNVTISLVLGIVSFIACCCSSGIGGVILSGIALVLANKDNKTLTEAENPEIYENAGQLKTARIIAIIGLALGAIILIGSIIWIITLGGWSEYQEWQQGILEQYGA